MLRDARCIAFAVAAIWISGCDSPPVEETTAPAGGGANVAADLDFLRNQVVDLAETVQVNSAELAAIKEKLAQNEAATKQLSEVFTEKAALSSAISPQALASGYILPFEGDEHLMVQPSGDGVMRLDPVGISVRGGAHLRTPVSAAMLSVPWSARGELSMAAMIQPANLDMTGPARIVSISRGAGSRNITLGQERSSLIVRFRTTSAGENGSSPELTSPQGTLTGDPQAVVFVRSGQQNLLYVDGQLAASADVGGDLSNWDFTMPLLIGNEAGEDRAWSGNVYRVAFFNRALNENEVQQVSSQLRSLVGSPQQAPAATGDAAPAPAAD